MNPREAQIAVTVTLLVAAGLLALLCDFVRIRSLRRDSGLASEKEQAPKRTLGRTLVPPH